MGGKKETDIGKLDQAMDFQTGTDEATDWYGVDDAGFKLDGLCWRKPGEAFRRLPENVMISPGVDELAWHTAGAMLRFCTDACEIRVAAKLWHNARMDHMPATGSMGFDIYTGTDRKIHAGTTRFDRNKDEYNVEIFKSENSGIMREFTLHFPLYSGVEDLKVGLSAGAKVQQPSQWRDSRPAIVYGTSIQQGGCASRPGMCHTNQMSRMLKRPFLNFGFSGSGKGEPAMAMTLAQISDPAIYILDYDANAGLDGLLATQKTFIDILRAAHPETPILLVSCVPLTKEFSDDGVYKEIRRRCTQIHLDELKRRKDSGDNNIYFLDGAALYGDDPAECTVDGVHATDLGFYQISCKMAPVIEKILSRQSR